MSETLQPVVVIIVLNWNKPADTLTCLRSLAQVTYPHRQVIVVDNGSTDDSVARIRATYPDVTLIETGANLGYAGGNNVGIRHALAHGADFTCILNNDVIVEPGFLEPLVAVAAECGGQRVVTPMICEMGRPDRIWALGGGLNWRSGSPTRLQAGEPREDWLTRAPYEVDFAPGTAFLAPRTAWETVGLMDEAFFLYFEETDWCVRARRMGFTMIAVPASCVWHEVEAASGRRSPQVTYYMTRNVLRFLQRNLPLRRRLGPMVRVLLLAHLQALSDVRHGETQRARARLRGVYDYLVGRFGPS